jgi:hypothetical protein
MKKLTLFVLIAILAVALVGCDQGSTEIIKVDCDPPPVLSASLEASMATIYLPDSPPPEITSEEGWILMDQTDVMLAEARKNLSDQEDPVGTPDERLLYMGSSDCIPDDVTTRLITLAYNDYDGFVEERLERLERYNEEFVEAGGQVPNWVWEDIRAIKWYLPPDSDIPQ